MNKDQEWDALTPDQAAQAYPHLEEEMVVCFGLVMTRAEAEDAIRLRRFAQGLGRGIQARRAKKGTL
ncbi:hypothetical protein SAMN05444156_2326 [Verrucomicrobium sp. GAS474]|nr:hypothetical protein SAMN05444156_2326 [Verrucomicrobium sp. GAS474]